MGDSSTAPQRPEFTVGERNLFSVSFDGKLDSGEVLSGTPTAAEKTTTDLTITNLAVSTTELVIDNKTVAVGRAMQCFVTGHLYASTPYTVVFTATTDSTPTQTKIGKGVFDVAEV